MLQIFIFRHQPVLTDPKFTAVANATSSFLVVCFQFVAPVLTKTLKDSGYTQKRWLMKLNLLFHMQNRWALCPYYNHKQDNPVFILQKTLVYNNMLIGSPSVSEKKIVFSSLNK